MKANNKYTKHSTQQGSSLLEVMIAGMLFMVGLLGLLATQGLSLKLSNTSTEHSAAAVLISDLYDRMRANPDGTAANAYNTTALNKTDTSSLKDCSKTDVTCTAAELAAYDQVMWKTMLRSQLASSAYGTITRSGTDNTQYSVNIIWYAQVENDSNLDGIEDAKTNNCAKGSDRPANERAFCAMLDVGRMEVF